MSSGESSRASDAKAADRLDAQLALLEDQLVSKYAHDGHHNETEVLEQFQCAVQHFANARSASEAVCADLRFR